MTGQKEAAFRLMDIGSTNQNEGDMTETAEQYRTRLAKYVEGRDPVTMQREAPGTIARLIEGVGHAKLKDQPAPGKWSVTEILMHLADDELVSTWRYRQMLEHETPTLAGFDQDLWARLGDYAACESEDALAMFCLLREANLRMFAHLTPEQWRRHGVHSERGKLTVRDLCRHMAAHDVNHIDQIRSILKENLEARVGKEQSTHHNESVFPSAVRGNRGTQKR